MDVYGAPYQISVSLVCSGKQPCRVPPWLAGIHLRDFTLTAFKAAVAVTLHASGVPALFSPMGEWANWQIGGIGICRWCQCWIRQQWAQHLGEMRCHEIWGGVPASRYPAMFLVSFFGLVSIRASFGWWRTCLLHPSHSAWYGRSMPTCYFCPFQTAWCLTAIVQASTMLFLRGCDTRIWNQPFGFSFFHNITCLICPSFPAPQ